MASLLFAQFEIYDFQSTIYFTLKLVVAIGAGFIGWFLSAPIARSLYRAAFHKPIRPTALFVSRLIGAALLAFLAFWLIPIGGGGGSGLGGGPGIGKQQGDGSGESTPKHKDVKPDEKPKELKTKSAVLPVEIIAKKNYRNDGRFYLIKGKEPAKTLKQMETYLADNKGRWEQIDILIYGNSFSEVDPSVVKLKDLAQRFELKTAIPPEYFTKNKTIKGNNN